MVGERERPPPRPIILEGETLPQDVPSPSPPSRPLPSAEVLPKVLDLLSGVEQGKGRAVTLLGAPGTGKSRLISDLGLEARERNWTVLLATGSPDKGELPRGLVLEALRPVLPGFSAEPAEARGPGNGSPSVGLPLALAAFLPAEPAPEPRPWAREPAAYATPWELPASVSPAEGDALLLRQLWDATRKRPVLLALDDVHCADPLSLGFLSSLCLGIHDRRVLLLLSLEPEPAPQLVRRFAPLSAGGLADETFTLAPRSLLKPRPLPPPVPPAPEEVEPSLLETILSYGAVLGIEFDLPTLAEVTGRGPLAVGEGLVEAARRGWVWKSGEDTYHFSGERTWRWALGLPYIPLSQRHAKAAAALERLHPRPDGRALFELARHWQEAGEVEASLPYMVRSAEVAYGVGAWEDARDRLVRAQGMLAAIPGPKRAPHEVRILVDLAEVLDALGQGVQAGSRLRQALALAESSKLPAREVVHIEVLLGDLQRRWGRGLAALEILERARARAEGAHDPVTEATVLSMLGMILRRRGQWSEARTTIERALQLLGTEGGAEERYRVHYAAADTYVWGGPEDTEAARSHIQECRDALRELGQPYREVPLINLEGLHASQLGDQERALALWRGAAELALRLGNLVDGANMLGNEAEVLAAEGKLEESRQCARTARGLVESMTEPRIEGQILLAEATLAWKMGEIETAFEVLRKGLAVLSSDASVDLRQQLEFLEARILLSKGDKEGALRLVEALDPLRYPHLLPPDQREEWEEMHRFVPSPGA